MYLTQITQKNIFVKMSSKAIQLLGSFICIKKPLAKRVVQKSQKAMLRK